MHQTRQFRLTPERQCRVAIPATRSRTVCGSNLDWLIMRSTSAATFCSSNASSRSRLSNAFFVLALVLDGLRRLTLGALERFTLVVVRRRLFMASLTAAGVAETGLICASQNNSAERRSGPTASVSSSGCIRRAAQVSACGLNLLRALTISEATSRRCRSNVQKTKII